MSSGRFRFCNSSLCEFFFLAPEKEVYRPLPALSCQGLRAINTSVDNARRANARPPRARGGVKHPLTDCHLTFTHRFRQRRSPHWGHALRKRLWTPPRTHMVAFAQCCIPHKGLAGAYRGSMITLLVGAPLPCTASRRCRNYAFSAVVCCCD